jgi:large exoprotein involved in heme utilization and adhesion
MKAFLSRRHSATCADYRCIYLILGYMAFVLGSPSVLQAQVTTSITPTHGTGSLGTTVTPSGTIYNITGGASAGTNLFHSFGNFSVGSGDAANFLNTPINGSLPLTSNILGRISGGNIPNIFGTMQTTVFEPESLIRRARR